MTLAPVYTCLKLERRHAWVRVVLARPQARNAVNLQLCLELLDVFSALERDDSVRAVTIEAEGPVFCAGADLKERVGKDAAWIKQRRHASFAAYDAIAAFSRPCIAIVDGPVVGAGGEIAMSCDFICATGKATFRFPEVHRGTVGATQRLQRVVGKRLAKNLLFTGREMTIDEACARGLVAQRICDGALAAFIDELGATIVAAPPLAMRLAKECIDLGERTDLATGIGIELAAIDRCLADNEWKDGIAAFNKDTNK